jgi:RNA 2',3'-cyclic 3'-phosphodiesterase
MRLFVALELPEEVKCHLVGLQGEISGIRWLPPEQLHLTMLFLGDVEEEKLAQIILALTEIRVAPFTLHITRIGCFPNARAPRVLWAGIERQPMLERLHLQIKTAAESCGIRLETCSFSPHITLARLKQPDSADVTMFLRQPTSNKIPPVTIEQFVLFQSVLTTQGAKHQPIQKFNCSSGGTAHQS